MERILLKVTLYTICVTLFMLLSTPVQLKAQTPHLCKDSVVATWTNYWVPFVCDTCTMIDITVRGSCDQGTCFYGIYGTSYTLTWQCDKTPVPNPRIECLPPGNYILSIDVCNGKTVTITCDPSIVSTCCH